MNITIYSTSTCAACEVLEKWLDSMGQTYTKKITDEDAEAMTAFMEVNDSMVGVPFSVITNDAGEVVEKISGYDQPKFKKALGLS